MGNFDDVITLVAQSEPVVSATGITEYTESRYECFAKKLSIGTKEFYQADSAGHKPELKFVLPDAEEYQGEKIVEYEGIRYKVLRTYQAGTQLEITVYGGVHSGRA